MKSKKLYVLSLIAVTAGLVACGGGGGGSGGAGTSGSAQVPFVPAPSVNTPLVLNVPTSTYAIGSEEMAAFTLLNTDRARCGFGKLAQSTQLDAAARAHADYQIINNVISHFENQAQFPVGFTGVNGFDRATAAGYTGGQAVSDNIAVKLGNTNKAGEGEAGIRRLLSAPYHASGMLRGFKEVGLAVRASNETTPPGVSAAVFLQANLGNKTADGLQVVNGSDVATYPCAGSTNINRQLTDEEPSPVPGRNLNTNPVGGAIYILLAEGNTLNIASASVVETMSNTPIVLRTPVTSANDPNARYKTNEGYVIPDAPLRALTQHSVDIRGTNNGVPFTRQFTFTTGA